MQIDAFARRIGGDEHQHFGVVLKGFLNLPPPFAGCATVDGHHRALIAKTVREFFVEIVQRVTVFRK